MAKKYSTEVIVEKIKALALGEGRYLPKHEVAVRIGVHRYTLTKKGIDSDVIFKSAGFPRTKINAKGSPEDRAEIIDGVVERYMAVISELGRPVPLHEFAQIIGVPPSKMSKLYRYRLDIPRIHESCGIIWSPRYKFLDMDRTEAKLMELIEKFRRYVTRDELAQEIGVSGSLLSQYRVDIVGINQEFGYVANGKSAESRVGQFLEEILGHKLERQKSFPDCRSDLGYPLHFDYFSPERNLLVEVDGPSHWNPADFRHSDAVVRRDSLKNDYARDNGMTLVRIRLDQPVTREYVRSALSGTPLKHSVGQPAAKPGVIWEGSETRRKP
jgi:very-short-patch-repair endonuclease